MLNSGSDVNRRNEDDAVSSSNEIPDDIEGAENVLFHAVQQRNNESVVHALNAQIDDGADVNSTNEDGKTVLFYAVQQSYYYESVVRTLIDAGADVNTTDNEGKPALFYAVQQSNNESVVRALIAAGADVNRTDNEGKTALFYVVQSNDESVVCALIEEGIHTSPRDIYGRTPLFYAMTKSQSITCYLLEKKVNVRIKDNCGMSFLSFFVDHCLSKPADSNIESCISERIDLIVQKGVKRNTVYVAIMNIIFCKCPLLFHSGINVPILIFFLELAKTYSTEHESDIDDVLEMVRKTVNDKTLFRTLIPQILDLLCELGADPNSADMEGNTALHHAVCLPFYGVSNEAVMDLLKKLEESGVTVDSKNHQSETPLLFCLTLHSNDQQIFHESKQLSSIRILVEVCQFLINNGSNVEETTKKGDSVLHLIMRLLQKILEWHRNARLSDAIQVGIELFILFSSTRAGRRVINKRDENLNSPIHLWASLEPPQQCLRDVANEGSAFSDFMKEVLNKLLECGAQLDERNKLGQTPLHLCRTLAAVELLLDSGANPNVVDVLGRSPLIVAAQNKTHTFFNPDVELDDPKDFWKLTALKKGLDPWVVDKHGNSVLSYLIESEAVDLAKAMIDVFCANKKNFPSADETTNTCTILNILCKDNKNEPWKREYVEKILQPLGKPLFEIKWSKTSPLHSCCRNIIEASKDDGSSVQTTVHWAIAKLLLSYKADCAIPDETGQSCLEIAEECSELKELLNKQINPEQVPNLTNWNPEGCVAIRYKKELEEVSKSNNCEKIDQSRIWFHKEHINSEGSFGCKVFAGIKVEDGMEVAIKRICKTKTNYEHEHEIRNLVKLNSVDHKHIIFYNCPVYHDNCIYLILELMEGTLSHLLSGDSIINTEERKSFCRQLLKGVHNMHETGIIHCHLRPDNILLYYNRSAGQLRLKIAGFGRSFDIKSDSPFPAIHEDDMGSKCWSAPEVLSCTDSHSKESDMFSCGLVLHYIALKKNPYESQNLRGTVDNIMNGKRNKWDPSLCPENVHVLESILKKNKKKRSTAIELLGYPFFWSDDKKVNFLKAVSDEKIECHGFDKRLKDRFKNIVKCDSWDSEQPHRKQMPKILEEMISMAEKKNLSVFYDNKSVRGLLRLIRNAHAHINDLKEFNIDIGTLVSDHVFLKYFPDLVVEVFKEIKLSKWDEDKPEIQRAINLH